MQKLMAVLIAALFAVSTAAIAQDKKGEGKKDEKKSRDPIVTDTSCKP